LAKGIPQAIGCYTGSSIFDADDQGQRLTGVQGTWKEVEIDPLHDLSW
jgi:hypothetical protein